MHVSGKGRGIVELDLASVFATEEERSALALVKSLDLSHNKLQQITTLQPLGCLEVLDVSHNNIKLLRGLPLTLVRLSLPFNHMTSLQGIAGLPLLEELDVSHNDLTSLAALTDVGGGCNALRVLKASMNRISSTAGLSRLLRLQMLLLDGNCIAHLDELQVIASLPLLAAVSFTGNPVAEVNDYLRVVCKLQPSLATVDGTPAVYTPQFTNPPSPSSMTMGIATTASRSPATHTIHRDIHTYSGSELQKSATSLAQGRAGNRQPHSTSQPNGAQMANSTTPVSGAPGQSAKHLERQLADALHHLQLEQRDAARWRQTTKQHEAQLAEAHRILREQLEEISALRHERDALREQVDTFKAKLQRAERNLKYQAEKHHMEMTKSAEEAARERAVFEVHIGDLRRRLSSGSKPSILVGHQSHLERSTTSSSFVSRDGAQQHRGDGDIAGGLDRTAASVVSHEHNDASFDVSHDAASALAKQLKSWLTDEIRRQAASSSTLNQSHGTAHGAAALSQSTPRAADHSPDSSLSSISDDPAANITTSTRLASSSQLATAPLHSNHSGQASPMSAARHITSLWKGARKKQPNGSSVPARSGVGGAPHHTIADGTKR